jgi:hypothetical protein
VRALRLRSEGERKGVTAETQGSQRCGCSLAKPNQEIAAAGVGQITTCRIATDGRKTRRPLLPYPTQTDAPWTFTCETEANILMGGGQG